MTEALEPVLPFLCIHGHFYQPPRENPWLEAVEQQDSAAPYHDWNQRITAECYGPNAAARMVDGEGRITAIVDNYARISFNFGPTLLAWLQQQAPEVHEALVAADQLSQQRFAGHGSALAQPYNHVIMPLAHPRDQRTQVRWGMRDFETRFHRAPEGMWLPETAVDLPTLELLAEVGIRFTILAPHQAARVRRIGEDTWEDVQGARIDPSMPYLLRLPSGRTISLFFFDGPVSRAVAFERLLANGEHFAERLLGSYVPGSSRGRLVHIATDGETYGHHHRFGEMALAYALQHVESRGLASLTNYGDYLERFPPTHEVEILERTSWSCAHGIERWRSDCGCSTGGPTGWNQSWRGPLRAAFDWVRDQLADPWAAGAGTLLADPWAARDAYIDVVLDRTPARVDAFLDAHATHLLNDAERTRALQLLEAQRNAMLMYTSCAWFFTEISGIETVQCLRYAARAVQLARECLGLDLEPGLVDRLTQAQSNLAEHGDGARVYERFVGPAVVDLRRAAAHYAISSLFMSNGERTSMYCFDVEQLDYRRVRAGRAQLATGQVRVASRITREAVTLSFGVLHAGDHTIVGGDRPVLGPAADESMADELFAAFTRGELPDVVRLLDRHFSATYSLRSLFRDEQLKVLDAILAPVREEAEATNRQLYDHYAPLMQYLSDLGYPRPRALQAAADLVLNADLQRSFQEERLDAEQIHAHLDAATRLGVPLDHAMLRFLLRARLRQLAEAAATAVGSVGALRELAAAVELTRALPFAVDLWQTQNTYWRMSRSVLPTAQGHAATGSESAQEWVRRFEALGTALGMRMPEG